MAPGAGYTPRPHEIRHQRDLPRLLDRHGDRPCAAGPAERLWLRQFRHARRHCESAGPVQGRSPSSITTLRMSEIRRTERRRASSACGSTSSPIDPRHAAGPAVVAACSAASRSVAGSPRSMPRDDQWRELAPLLERSGVKVLIDHFGVSDLAVGIDSPGFQAVLALGPLRQCRRQALGPVPDRRAGPMAIRRAR